MRKNTILVGNGINRINNNQSWLQLLKQLITYINKSDVIITEQKPFPLLYEEILLRGLMYRGITENKLKEKIAKQMKRLKVNSYHNRLVELPVENIITTNYDYNIEIACGCSDRIIHKRLGGNRLESKYRMYTYNYVLGKRIWHIHGEVNYPNTIVLGHEFYGKVLEKMIRYVSKLYDKSEGSWIDLFFDSDIHIIGFEYDFTEIDLWWLINSRARLKYVNKHFINNSINFYMPIINDDFHDLTKVEQEERILKNERKRQLLECHDVKVIEIECGSYREYYDEVFNEMSSLHNGNNTLKIS